MVDKFWETWEQIGHELIAYGNEIKFGNSLVEVKFFDGKPSVIIRSKSIKKKYPDTNQAEIAIAKELSDSRKLSFDGARTFTVAFHDGEITQVLLDEYANRVLK